jgi:hypothetical protein
MVYDVYYTTGGGPWVNAGSDTWVNLWMELIAPKLDVKPILLIHRNKPKGHEDYQFPIETYWHGDDIDKFEELCKGARRINILHGHYTPMKCIVDNKDKIHSNILHNSVDHILKSQVVTDASLGWHPYLSSEWEKEVNEWSTHTIWVGLFDILFPNKNISNFYEFKHNLELSDSNSLGFAARCEGRKNPHYLDGLKSYIFTNSVEFNAIWKNGAKIDTTNAKIYHYTSEFKDIFYNMDWGISHSAFTSEPFGYSIFEAVDRGKLPIIHTNWCKDLNYPYRASSKKEFFDIYTKITNTSYEEKLNWFNIIKKYMKDNYTNKDLWINSLLDIYNII